MEINVKTLKNKQILDITNLVNDYLIEQNFKQGLCHLFVKHTTASLTCADLDPGTDLDMLDAFEAIIPKLKYRHPHNPLHVGDHIMSSMIGPSIIIPVENSELVLGAWQKAVLIELDGPRVRTIILTFLKI